MVAGAGDAMAAEGSCWLSVQSTVEPRDRAHQGSGEVNREPRARGAQGTVGRTLTAEAFRHALPSLTSAHGVQLLRESASRAACMSVACRPRPPTGALRKALSGHQRGRGSDSASAHCLLPACVLAASRLPPPASSSCRFLSRRPAVISSEDGRGGPPAGSHGTNHTTQQRRGRGAARTSDYCTGKATPAEADGAARRRRHARDCTAGLLAVLFSRQGTSNN
jgi:hypothetical protein